MTIVYFSNFLNHHQKFVADELVSMEGVKYTFVETVPMYDWLKRGGYSDFSHESYVLRAWENEYNRKKAVELAKNADVALFGGPDVLDLEVIRAKYTNKLTFDVSERWLKKGWLNFLSPRLLKSQFYYHTLFCKRSFYKLCASAFAAADQYKMHSYIDRCYKWGYFTQVEDGFNVEDVKQGTHTTETIPLMWCSRFLQWKHPELPVLIAERLKRNGYKFHIDMFGSGERLGATRELISKCNVGDFVTLRGNLPNAEVLREMRKHKIFIFSSDKNEGWGAVLNEAMANGCVPVVSSAVGSAPFLVEDGINGFLFDSPNLHSGILSKKIALDEHALNSLYEKVIRLLDNPQERCLMAENAHTTMTNVWSPRNAAKNFLQLVEDLSSGRETSIMSGPCSKALPI